MPEPAAAGALYKHHIRRDDEFDAGEVLDSEIVAEPNKTND